MWPNLQFPDLVTFTEENFIFSAVIDIRFIYFENHGITLKHYFWKYYKVMVSPLHAGVIFYITLHKKNKVFC